MSQPPPIKPQPQPTPAPKPTPKPTPAPDRTIEVISLNFEDKPDLYTPELLDNVDVAALAYRMPGVERHIQDTLLGRDTMERHIQHPDFFKIAYEKPGEFNTYVSNILMIRRDKFELISTKKFPDELIGKPRLRPENLPYYPNSPFVHVRHTATGETFFLSPINIQRAETFTGDLFLRSNDFRTELLRFLKGLGRKWLIFGDFGDTPLSYKHNHESLFKYKNGEYNEKLNYYNTVVYNVFGLPNTENIMRMNMIHSNGFKIKNARISPFPGDNQVMRYSVKV